METKSSRMINLDLFKVLKEKKKVGIKNSSYRKKYPSNAQVK